MEEYLWKDKTGNIQIQIMHPHSVISRTLLSSVSVLQKVKLIKIYLDLYVFKRFMGIFFFPHLLISTSLDLICILCQYLLTLQGQGPRAWPQ